jgi:Uri superfamily endonuclease
MILKGTYVLFMEFSEDKDIQVGSLGECHLECGTYCYVGSAMGGIEQRVGRHLASTKVVRWHIDRLTLISDHKEAYISYPDFIPECDLAKMAEGCGAAPVIKGFGCSDCHCYTHLFMINDEVKEKMITNARLVPFHDKTQH